MRRQFAIAAIALVLAGCSGPDVEPSVDPSVEPSVVARDTGTPASSSPLLPSRRMPGARASAGGEYGWTGALGSRTGMHAVVEVEGGGYRQTQIVFAVENDCFASGEGPEPVSVTVAGLDARYVEPYDGPGTIFMPQRASGQTTGAYALPIGDRTLCVYLTWDATSTTEELDAARSVVESIRGEPVGERGIRIVFTLPPGWDTG